MTVKSPTTYSVLAEVRHHFYTYREVRAILGLSKVTLWRWVQAGKLTAFKLGQESLFEKLQIDELKATQLNGALTNTK